LGSGIAFLDGAVVTVALRAIGADFHTAAAGLQWTVTAYLVTLTGFLLLGADLGDLFGRRRVFVLGLAGFTVGSALCAAATNPDFLIAARAAQGTSGALLVPGGPAIIASVFHPDDRRRAIGTWAGLTGVATAIAPFLGGWLIDAVSWRLIFVVNAPIAAIAISIAMRKVPETTSSAPAPLDVGGALLATVALAAISFAVISHQGVVRAASGLAGLGAVLVLLLVERKITHPMIPLGIFGIRQFTLVNIVTLAVYAGIGGAFFLLILRLEVSLHYSALEAGAALVPFALLMVILSPPAGQFGQRVGARVPMTVGPLVASVGIVLLSGVSRGDPYPATVLPAVVVFGIGGALTVAPLTAAVLGAVGDDSAGTASEINNAAARLAGLLAVAVLPALTGISSARSLEAGLDHGYAAALLVAGGVTAAGGLVAALAVRVTAPVPSLVQPSPFHACQHPAIATRGAVDQTRAFDAS
jgi:EmrB/QacA subfamily drug resistance transporter